MFQASRTIKKFVPEFVVSTVASVADSSTLDCANLEVGQNYSATITCVVGDVYINTLETASTDNGLKLFTGDSIEMMVRDRLSCVSDSTVATLQARIYQK